jgi:prepilin-type N-terminal cleavage/methylation domain-containing protein
MRRSRGLTLIEILVVLAIIALVTAIALPMVTGTSNAEIRSAARQLASGLRLARSEAVSQRRETFLVIDLAAAGSRSTATRASIRCLATWSSSSSPPRGSGRREGRLDPLLSGRRQQRRPHHARQRRSQVRSGRRLAHRRVAILD